MQGNVSRGEVCHLLLEGTLRGGEVEAHSGDGIQPCQSRRRPRISERSNEATGVTFVAVTSFASMLWVGVKPLVLKPFLPPPIARESGCEDGPVARGLCFYPGTRAWRGPLRRCSLEPDTWAVVPSPFRSAAGRPATNRTHRARATRSASALRDLQNRARRYHPGRGIPPQRDH